MNDCKKMRPAERLTGGLITRNRPLFKAYGTGCKGNNAMNLLIGYLIGIVMNGACILMALADLAVTGPVRRRAYLRDLISHN